MTKPIDRALSPEFIAAAAHRRATWSMSAYDSLDAVKDAEYISWSAQSTALVMATVSEMAAAAHGLKDIHVRRLHRPHRTAQ